MPKIINVTIFNDPGHAWGAVPHESILELGIAEEISTYSYMSDSKVFLEEDCDLGNFIAAADKAGWRIERSDHSPADREGDEWVLWFSKERYPVNSGLVDLRYGKTLDTATGKIVPRVSVEDAKVIVRLTEKHAKNSSKVRSYGQYAAEWVGKLKVGDKIVLKSAEGVWAIVETKGTDLIVENLEFGWLRYRVPKTKVTNYLAEPIAA